MYFRVTFKISFKDYLETIAESVIQDLTLSKMWHKLHFSARKHDSLLAFLPDFSSADH